MCETASLHAVLASMPTHTISINLFQTAQKATIYSILYPFHHVVRTCQSPDCADFCSHIVYSCQCSVPYLNQITDEAIVYAILNHFNHEV